MPVNVHIGFLTNNAGDDIPGSTIKWTIETFGNLFSTVIVVDGRLTNQAIEFYKTIPNCKVVNSPWAGNHAAQYIARNSQVPKGDWLLMLDCDEAPTKELALNIQKIVQDAELNKVNIICPPSINLWCKNNSNKFYPTNEINPNNLPVGGKRLLYKNTDYLRFGISNTGTHVTPVQVQDQNLVVIKDCHFHFKSPETTIFNAAVCIMDDLFPAGEPPDGGLRGFTMSEVNTLKEIGTRHGLLNKESFRIATKARAWPEELATFVKRFKHRAGHCRMLYTLYYVLMGMPDSDPLSYEDACEIGTLNDTYKKYVEHGKYITVPHTPVMLTDLSLPVGAG